MQSGRFPSQKLVCPPGRRAAKAAVQVGAHHDWAVAWDPPRLALDSASSHNGLQSPVAHPLGPAVLVWNKQGGGDLGGECGVPPERVARDGGAASGTLSSSSSSEPWGLRTDTELGLRFKGDDTARVRP